MSRDHHQARQVSNRLRSGWKAHGVGSGFLVAVWILWSIVLGTQDAQAAFPAVQATNTSATTVAGTSHTVNLPTGIQSGDLLIALFSGFIGSGSTAVAVGWPSGWTGFFAQDASTSTLHLTVAGAYRLATGSEGSSITVTTNLSVLAAHNSYRITGAADPATQPPEAASIPYTSAGSSIDPPSLTPTGGAKDYLWLAVAGWRRTGVSATTDPTNYTGFIEGSSGGSSSGTKLRSLRRQLNAASENPSAFTLSATTPECRVGVTIAVHPSAGTMFVYRRSITIKALMTSSVAACSSSLSNFPILVSRTDATLATVANGGTVYSSSGYDIIFRAADGVTQLDHEIERYDGVNGEVIAWVRIPTLTYNADTTMYMYYSNPGVTAATANPTGVWDSNYLAVYHLNQAPPSTILDSKGSINLTPNGNAAQGTGQVGYGITLDGTGDYLLSTATLTTTSFTMEAWVSNVSIVAWPGWQAIVDIDNEPTVSRDFTVYPDIAVGSLAVDDGHGGTYRISDPQSGTAWRHLAGRFSSSGNSLRGFINGTQTSYTSAPGWGAITGRVVVGAWSDGSSFYDYWNGTLDEVRISNNARDNCWIGVEFNSVQYAANTSYLEMSAELLAGPTAVELISLMAADHPGQGVLVSWRTGFEVDNLGFHVYREQGGQRVRVTPSLVAGSALFAGVGTPLTAGRSYSWWDRSPVAGASYWLEEWELSGAKRWHGPVSVQPGVWQAQAQGLAVPASGGSVQGSSPLLAGLGQPASPSPPQGVRRRLRQGVGSGPDRRAVQWGLASRAAVKLLVSEEGWFRVSQEELVRAGLDPGVDPGRLQLFADGEQVPILVDVRQQGVFASGDGIEFYGEGLDTPSTAVRVYWLTVGLGEGLRVREAVGGGRWAPGPASFPTEVERADRTLYFPALLNGDEENFFGAVVTDTPVAQSVRVQHVDQTVPGELVVRLQGGTAGAHRVGVELNGVRVGTVVWEEMAVGELVVPVPGRMVWEGDNRVVLTAEGGEGDVSAVESIRVRYQHTWDADGEALEFSLGGYQEVTIGGFRSSRVKVLDITDPGAVQALPVEVVEEGGDYRATVGVPEPGERTLLAVGTGAVRHPVGVLANRPTAWHQATEGADLLIIGHRSLLSALAPLRALRESQGLAVAVVDVESVFDEFAFGARSPQAIRDFLAYVKDTWSRPPRYLLLVGDASYDPRSYLGYGYLDLVPTRLVDTAYMETASDDWFADFDGDGIADIPVGRLPVQTSWEAATVIGKIVAYDGSAKLARVLLVADANDEDNDFEGLSGSIKAVLPSTVWAVEVYRGQLGDGAAKLQLMNGIDLGQTLINYVGHGSVGIWHDNLLTSDEARALGNDRFGLVVSMTCLNGFFHDPFEASLAEAFLQAPAGGAVAVWASSGLTESEAQLPIDEALVRLLFSGTTTLGDATRAAKAATTDMDVRRTWILFGDPTTTLRR